MEQIALSYSQSDLVEMGDHYRALNRLVPLGPITSADHYDRAVATLDALMDAGAGDEAHPLAGLLALVGEAVGDYDDAHHRIPEGTPTGALRLLMEQHGLSQRDLTEIGSQGVVSEVLSGKRPMTVRQVVGLAKRFGVSPAVFVDLGL